MLICRWCDKETRLEDFCKTKDRHGRYRNQVCLKCWNNRYRTSISRHASIQISNSRRRSLAKGLPFDLTKEWLIAKLKAGKCELTGLPLVFDYKKRAGPQSPTLDRIIPSRGYTKANIRVICFSVNCLLSEFGDAEALRMALYLVKAFKGKIRD